VGEYVEGSNSKPIWPQLGQLARVTIASWLSGYTPNQSCRKHHEQHYCMVYLARRSHAWVASYVSAYVNHFAHNKGHPVEGGGKPSGGAGTIYGMDAFEHPLRCSALWR
jgi:hypothetical protein